jgi:glycosyltransferase involved in cell wall biosynthesis
MIFDTMTIACCAAVLIIALVSAHCNAFFRKFNETERQEDNDLPKLSVIITAHDQAQELSNNLPAFLSQVYPAGYEVIVVNAASNDDTEDVLKRFKSINSNLYTTFTPDSSRYMSRKKLAITLGVKAAKNEWIVLTEPSCIPISDKWLASIGHRCTDHNDIVIGYSNFQKGKNIFRKFIGFERLVAQYYNMNEAAKRTAFCAGGHNIAFRKSEFMKVNGFSSNLRYLRGEYDFIINDLAKEGRTAIVTEPDSRLEEQGPTTKSWRNGHLFYMETRKHLQRRHSHRMLYNIDITLLIISYLLEIGGIISSALLSLWIITAAASLALIISLTLRTIYGMKIVKRFHEDTPAFCIVPYEIFVVFCNFGYKIRYMMADKMDFIRK